MKALSLPPITLITTLNINESLYYSILTSQEFTDREQALKTINATLVPFLTRVTLNTIRTSLIKKKFMTPDLQPLITLSDLPSPPIVDYHVLKGRPKCS